MQWSSDIDVCTLIILALIGILQFSKSYISIKRSRVFLLMLVLQILAVGCSIAVRSPIVNYGYTPGLWSKILVDLYYVVQYAVPIVLMQYMVVWSGRSLKVDLRAKILFLIPVVTYAGIMLWNCRTQGLYVWDAKFGFVKTEAVWVLGLITIYCMVYGMIYATMYIRKLAFGKLMIIAVAEMAVIVEMVVQYTMPYVEFMGFIVTAGLLVLYLVAQNQSDMMDNNTQVLNRNMFDELLRGNITRGKSFDLIVLALDDFKFVNKTFGVTTGDMVLRQVAQFLTTVTEKSNVYRYGADQFALELDSGDVYVDSALKRIQERFRHPWITEDVSVMLSTTISCVSYPEDGTNMANIIDVIDYSVLSAKTSGRGTVVYAKDLDLNALRREKSIEKAVEKAINNDTIQVYYQPIYNTEKQCYTSAEALVRLVDDELGNIPPDLFIPISEKNGTIVKLGLMIFEKVCHFIAKENLRETSIEYIEINVSVVQCMQRDFVDDLLQIMRRYNVKPDQINLEVTETAAANSLVILQENIGRLHAQGIAFSLDDYGSGYSTLGYIHQFPFNIIKLDRLMIWDAFASEKAGITLKYTVGMLKELKVGIVAEGVETQEQKAHLEAIGCDYLQGWYYSKAVPENEFMQLIEQAS